MKSKHPISLLCLFLLLLLVCCKHEPPPKVCQYDSSVEEMKKWYYFKTGTWWVYQEQNTGVLDTITVYYDWDGLSQSGYDGFEWYGNSSLDGFNYYYTFNSSYSIHCLSENECKCHKVDRAKGQSGNFVGAGQIFLYPLIEGNYSYLISSDGLEGGKTLMSNFADTLSLFENNYTHVAHWIVDLDGSMGDISSEYDIAENFGIIKAKYPELNEIWELKESFIIQ
jgi:hypothetical protein